MGAPAKYDKYLLPLRRISMRHDFEINRMFDDWVRLGLSMEDRRTQFWAVVDAFQLEWRQALDNMEKDVRRDF